MRMHINSLPSEPREESREARERRIRHDVRQYMDKHLHDKRIKIHHDPAHADVAAVRVHLYSVAEMRSYYVDFLWTDDGMQFTPSYARLCEVEYTSWPPLAS